MSSKPTEERLAVFMNMAKADPDNELAHFSLGKAYLELGDPRSAEASLRRTLELSPEHALAHRYLGEALMRLGNKEEAVKVLRSGILAAHARGEWKPRAEMQELLRQAGVEPTALPPSEAATTTALASGVEPPGAPARAVPDAFTCRRCGRPNPPLDEPPFPNELGREIRLKICKPCWREWMGMSIKVINEYRLNLMLPEAQEVYDTHLREFLGL